MTETLDGIKHFDNIDVESYLGFGEVFKNSVRAWQKSAKDVERNIKNVERRISATKCPGIYKQ